MASWRVGDVVFPTDLAEAMEKVQDTNLICAAVPSQLLALEALRLGRPWVQSRLEQLAHVRDGVYASLQALGDIAQFPRTQGAFYILLRLPGVQNAITFNHTKNKKHKNTTKPKNTNSQTEERQGN